MQKYARKTFGILNSFQQENIIFTGYSAIF